MIEERTGAKLLSLLHSQLVPKQSLKAWLILVTMEEWLWEGEDLGASWIKAPIRDSLKDQADQWRNNIVEAAVEMDDDAMEAYLEGNRARR